MQTALTQYTNYNMHVYLSNRRYRECLRKPHLPDGGLNSGAIRNFSEC